MIYGFGIEMCSVLWVKEKQELEEDLEDENLYRGWGGWKWGSNIKKFVWWTRGMVTWSRTLPLSAIDVETMDSTICLKGYFWSLTWFWWW